MRLGRSEQPITKIPSCSANSGDLHILGERIVELLITGASSSSGSIRRRKGRNGIAGREVRRQADGAPRFGGAAPGRVCLAEDLVIATPQERYPDSAVKVSKASIATRVSPKT